VRSRSGKNLAPHRPKKIFDRDKVAQLRTQGLSVRQIAKKLGIGVGTASRTLQERSKTTNDCQDADAWISQHDNEDAQSIPQP